MEKKKMKELAKIRQLELDLANVTKIQRQQKMKNLAKKAMELGDVEEQKSERQTKLTTSGKTTANSANKRRPPSGKSGR